MSILKTLRNKISLICLGYGDMSVIIIPKISMCMLQFKKKKTYYSVHTELISLFTLQRNPKKHSSISSSLRLYCAVDDSISSSKRLMIRHTKWYNTLRRKCHGIHVSIYHFRGPIITKILSWKFVLHYFLLWRKIFIYVIAIPVFLIL